MPRRKRYARGRSPHSGVKLKKRVWASGQATWLARWVDPVTGRWREQSLHYLGLENEDGRREWAVKKSRALASERAQLASSGVITKDSPTTVRDAVTDFLDRARGRLRGRTVLTYERDLATLAAFLEAAGVPRLEKLSSVHVVVFREEAASQRRRHIAPGGRRGERKTSDVRRAPATVNRLLSSVKAFLMDARRQGRTPLLDRDAIADGLMRLREPRPRPVILRSAEIRTLLEAALRHDRETFRVTRLEHDGLKLAGTTPRYAPIVPLVLTALLSGCRISELLTLRWENVHLVPPKSGELIVTVEASKTGCERAVTLAESPSLVLLLAALKLKSGGAPYVFGGAKPLARGVIEAARRRMVGTYGAPSFTWQRLRETCASFLCCAPGIYVGAANTRESNRLGHSVVVAARHYVGMLTEIPREAKILEAAMEIEDQAERIVRAAGSPVYTVAGELGEQEGEMPRSIRADA